MIRSVLFALLLATSAYAGYTDCPTLASFKRAIDFTAPGMVPLKMPYYDEFAGQDDPYWHPDGNFWIVISNRVRISDGPSGRGRAYMSGMVVAGSSTDSRATVLANAQALLEAASFEPSDGTDPAYTGDDDTYIEDWDTGGYSYEMCLYSGDAGSQAIEMTTGTTIAEMMGA